MNATSRSAEPATWTSGIGQNSATPATIRSPRSSKLGAPFGLSLLAAHLVVFWFSLDSCFTGPVYVPSDMDPEVGYSLLKITHENIDFLGGVQRIFKSWTPE